MTFKFVLAHHNKIEFQKKEIKSSSILLFLVAIFWSLPFLAQKEANIITNGGFEQVYVSAPTIPLCWASIDSGKPFGELLIPPSTVPKNSYTYQWPRTGKNHLISLQYCSQCPNIKRGYPRNRFRQNLQPGKVYCISLFVNLANEATHSIDEVGVYIGGSELDTIKYCNIPLVYLVPQIISPTSTFLSDTLSWVQITGTYTATGNEKYLLIGNFKSDLQTNKVLVNPANLPGEFSDYLIDDVSCIEMELPAYAGKDTAVMWGDSAFIGREPDVGIDEACQWYRLPNDSVPIDTVAGLWVKPAQTSTYVVRQQLWCSGVKWDTVVVYVGFVGLDGDPGSTRLQVSPNPSKGFVRLTGLPDGEHCITIFDAAGKMVEKQNVFVKDGDTTLRLAYADGLYFFTVNISGNILRRKLIIQK